MSWSGRTPRAALFIVGRPGDRFAAIEAPAAVTGLPIVRAEREIDPQLLRSAELGFRNGHVPVTGIISAIAVLAAALDGRDAVVMSNEWSASIPTLEDRGRAINHQYSKSAAFEAAFRSVLAQAGLGWLPDYFSALRPFSELWVAQRFARLTQYHSTFRSCNRAFHIDPARRLDHWCGQCDKCCFIDLILAPFLAAADLERIFGGQEPLADPDPHGELAGRFRTLLGTSPASKPFECVGEVSECRAAAARGRRPAGPGGRQAAPDAGRRAGRAARADRRGRPAPPARASTSSRMRMRPTISWSELRGASVGVWGLGVEGLANVRKLDTLGVSPVLVDDQPPAEAVAGRPVLATADGGLAALARCDVVVKSPGISRYRDDLRQLEARGIPVAGGLGLWLQEAPRSGCCASPGPRARAAPRPSPGTC